MNTQILMEAIFVAVVFVAAVYAIWTTFKDDEE